MLQEVFPTTVTATRVIGTEIHQETHLIFSSSFAVSFF